MTEEEYIRDLRAGQAYSIGKFDDQVLLISSGALVLSLNFLKDFIALEKAIYLGALYFSWVILGITVILSFTAHLISYDRTERQIQRLEQGKELEDQDKLTIRLNKFMAASLILGMACQIFFTTTNTIHMSEKNKITKPIKEKGAGLPVQSPPVNLKPKKTQPVIKPKK